MQHEIERKLEMKQDSHIIREYIESLDLIHNLFSDSQQFQQRLDQDENIKVVDQEENLLHNLDIDMMNQIINDDHYIRQLYHWQQQQSYHQQKQAYNQQSSQSFKFKKLNMSYRQQNATSNSDIQNTPHLVLAHNLSSENPFQQ